MLLEVQKIWFRVMSIYYRSGNRAVKIPSSNELAREFNMAPRRCDWHSRSWRRRATLSCARGSGTYTNPVKSSQFGVNGRKPLIGLLLLTGDLFFYLPSILKFISAATEVLAQMNWNVRFITERCASPEETEEVLRHSYLDGLICFSVKPGVAEKAAEILPTVNLNFDVEGVPCVYSASRPVLNKLREITGCKDHIEVDFFVKFRSVILSTESFPQCRRWYVTSGRKAEGISDRGEVKRKTDGAHTGLDFYRQCAV
ncbi:MAG: hypothetical protein L6W00_21710 [Lentisphaeria bacterium]|nr:MAG: hypothetical protein L6W00_21710 [Lentisphaeria bacterium]